MRMNYFERITIDPQIMVGKPVIKGTRIPVDLIVRMVAQGIPYDEIMSDYPRLVPEDIQAALMYAADAVWDRDHVSEFDAWLADETAA